MSEVIPTLKEAAEAAEQLISSISQHPAMIKSNAILKKGQQAEEPMDIDSDSLLDLIDVANKLVAEIDDRIKVIYKSVMNSYARRFPELRVADPVQYLTTVQLLGNEPERVNDETVKNKLAEVLEPKMVLLVTMTAATTQGVRIEEETVINNIMRACCVAMELTRFRVKLLNFVECNMATIAPNLSMIVGAPIAAKLMGLAGGLTQLATMPSCNLPVLGAHRVSNIESNDVNAPPRVGLIYECKLVQNIPLDHTKDVRKRAVKWVANKCVLAARCDVSQSNPNGDAGQMFRSQIENFISKELEPPPKKAPRPLPAPIEKSGKKRGGKRVRRMKERYGQTELRKAANRINFGDVGDDVYQNDLGFGRTQLNAIQKLRGPQINEKTKIRLSKSTQKKLNKAQSASAASTSTSTSTLAPANNPSGGGGMGNGLTGAAPGTNGEMKSAITAAHSAATASLSSVAATPSIVFTAQQQGLEIYNPKARESSAVETSNETSNYFSNSAGFFNLGSKS